MVDALAASRIALSDERQSTTFGALSVLKYRCTLRRNLHEGSMAARMAFS
jgi:hypothetical protein